MNADARELQVFIENEADLYRQQFLPILKNLMTKHAQGKYDRQKAVKLFMYLVDNGARKYTQQHGSPGQKWNDMFPKRVRLETAAALRDDFEDEAKTGNYDEYIPKKYRGKVSGKTLGEGQEQDESGPLFDAATRDSLHEVANTLSTESGDGEISEGADPLRHVESYMDEAMRGHSIMMDNLNDALNRMTDYLHQYGPDQNLSAQVKSLVRIFGDVKKVGYRELAHTKQLVQRLRRESAKYGPEART